MNSNTQELVRVYRVPSTVVEFELAKIVADLTEKGLTGTDLETEADELIVHVLRTMTAQSKGELFTGMVLAVDKLKDNANPSGKPSRRQLQVNAYVANPEETIAAGKVAVLTINPADGTTIRTMKDKKSGEVVDTIVPADLWKDLVIPVGDVKVVPLDDTKTWPGGKENFSYLHNLPLHQYRTPIVVVLKTSDGYKLAELDYNSERLPGNIPMYVPIEFVATVKEPKDGIIQLGTSKFTTFELSAEPFGKTPLELLTTFLGGIKYKIEKLEAYHTQMVKAGKQWDTLVMVEAYVSEIRGVNKGAPYLLINDNTGPLDNLTKVWLHDGIYINFGQNSKVFIIGKTTQSDKYDAETKTKLKGVPGDITISAMGVYAKFNTAPTNMKPLTGVNL
jgi:hypothetical protein